MQYPLIYTNLLHSFAASKKCLPSKRRGRRGRPSAAILIAMVGKPERSEPQNVGGMNVWGISKGFRWFLFFVSESGFFQESRWNLLHWRSWKTQVLITLGYLDAWGVCVVGEDDTLLDTYSPLPADSSDLHRCTGIERIALDLERMQLFDRTYLQKHSCHR